VASFDRSVLRRPRWILAFVVGLLLASLFVRLGVWQLDRLDQRRTANALILERAAQPPRALEPLISQYGLDPAALEYRPTTVEGTYRPDLEFISIGRTAGGVSGTLVATPLERDDGTLLVVLRGIVPSGTPGPPVEGYEAPEGRVVLTGRLDDGEEPLRLGEPDPEDGVIRSISRIDLDYIDTWTDGDVLPITLILDTQEPVGRAAAPQPIPPDEISEGPHLGYAVQWFAFAIIAIIGAIWLVWRAGTEEPQGVIGDGDARGPAPGQ
jgi:surfeit locus 1 family protein